jgi:transposase
LFLLDERRLSRTSRQFLPSQGVARVDERRVVSGVARVILDGLQSKDAAKAYGPAQRDRAPAGRPARRAAGGQA